MCKPSPANSLPSREAASASSRFSQQPSCPYSDVHLWSKSVREVQDRVTGLTFHSFNDPLLDIRQHTNYNCKKRPLPILGHSALASLLPSWMRIHLKSHFSHWLSCPSLVFWQNFELSMLQNDSRTYLRKFSRSSRLQDDQERSLGFRPFTHSPDMMCDRPAQDEWSSSWFIPRLLREKEKEWGAVSHVPHC